MIVASNLLTFKSPKTPVPGIFGDFSLITMESNIHNLIHDLEAACSQQDIPLNPEEAELLVRHALLVNQKNKSCNLTGIRPIQKSLYLNTLDSLYFVSSYRQLIEEGLFLDDLGNAEHKRAPFFVDMGTGGGFPGIPFGIMTQEKGLLLDSVNKKAEAVGDIIEKLHLQKRIEAKALRTEEMAKKNPCFAQVALARALAPLEVLLEYASPLLTDGGFLIASKGSPQEEEIAASKAAEALTGMRLVSRETRELPQEQGHRELFVYQKAFSPRVSLPRKPGMATKRPISTTGHI